VGTLYDVLQVSPEANSAVIRAAYENLSAAVRGNDSDSDIRKKALDEAFFTLSNTDKRQRYDQRLADRMAIMDADTSSSRTKYLLILATLVACGFGYMKYSQNQENLRIERERIAAEVRKAALQAKQEEDERRADMERLRLERQAEQQQRYAFEAARREADYAMRANSAADDRARREAASEQTSKQRSEQIALQNEQREAQRRLDRDKAYLRQLEIENSRGRRVY
jgi:colicin import membrane protein